VIENPALENPVIENPVIENTTSADATPEERRALFRVVHGGPTDAELAALTVVLAAATARAAPKETTHSAWTDPLARVRRPLQVGSGAWHTSTWLR
jgi:hypothetical protein